MAPRKRIFDVRKSNALKSRVAERKTRGNAVIETESMRHLESLAFEEKVAQAIGRALADVPIEVYESWRDEMGQKSNFFLHNRKQFYTPDIQLATADWHLPIEVKAINPKRQKKKIERFKERLVPTARKYLGGRLIIRRGEHEFVLQGSPPAKEVLLITSSRIPLETVERTRSELGVHTLSIHELEMVADMLPPELAEHRDAVRQRLLEEKIKIVKFFGWEES